MTVDVRNGAADKATAAGNQTVCTTAPVGLVTVARPVVMSSARR